MTTKTKWLIALGSVAVLGTVAYFTRDKWMPKKEEAKKEPVSEPVKETKPDIKVPPVPVTDKPLARRPSEPNYRTRA